MWDYGPKRCSAIRECATQRNEIEACDSLLQAASYHSNRYAQSYIQGNVISAHTTAVPEIELVSINAGALSQLAVIPSLNVNR